MGRRKAVDRNIAKARLDCAFSQAAIDYADGILAEIQRGDELAEQQRRMDNVERLSSDRARQLKIDRALEIRNKSLKKHNRDKQRLIDALEAKLMNGATMPNGESITIDDLGDGWEDAMEIIASNGGGKLDWMIALNIDYDAWDALIVNSAIFRRVVSKCNMLYQVWFRQQGQRMIQDGVGNGAVWKAFMTNDFGWQSKIEVVGDPARPIGIEAKTTNLPPSREELEAELIKRGLPLPNFD